MAAGLAGLGGRFIFALGGSVSDLSLLRGAIGLIIWAAAGVGELALMTHRWFWVLVFFTAGLASCFGKHHPLSNFGRSCLLLPDGSLLGVRGRNCGY
jgi:hypothetical protein